MLRLWAMNRMLETPSMWVIVHGPSKTIYLKNCTVKVSHITRITEVEAREITTSQGQETQRRDRYSESCGMAPAEINRTNRCREEASPNPVPFLARQMLTLRSKCTETGTSATTSSRKRKRTWTWCSTTSMALPSALQTTRRKTSTNRDLQWKKKAKKAYPPRTSDGKETECRHESVVATEVQTRISGAAICRRRIYKQLSATETRCTR